MKKTILYVFLLVILTNNVNGEEILYTEDQIKEIQLHIHENIESAKAANLIALENAKTDPIQNLRLKLNEVKMKKLEESLGNIGNRSYTVEMMGLYEGSDPVKIYARHFHEELKKSLDGYSLKNAVFKKYTGRWFVILKSNGSCEAVEIIESTQNKDIDQEIIMKIKSACPYKPFPKSVYLDYDKIKFSRIFSINPAHRSSLPPTVNSSIELPAMHSTVIKK